MQPGALDKSITIQVNTPTENAFGELVDSWSTLVATTARVIPERGSERYTTQQLVGKAVLTFRIRWRSDVTVRNRIVYDGDNYEVMAPPREVGRREFLDIDGFAIDG